MAASPRLTLVSPLRIWLIFNALFVALVASSWYSSYRLAAADEQRLVVSQLLTLTKSRFDDLKSRRFRDFVEGVGREFSGLYIRIQFSDQTFESGEWPASGHCADIFTPLGQAGSAQITMCRPFSFSGKPVVAVLLVYLLISGLSLAYVRRLEHRTTAALVDFLKKSGVNVEAKRGLVGIMADMREIRDRLDRAKNQERQLVEARARTEIAEQVAHDILSPLTVMEGMAADFTRLPDETRELFQGAVTRVRRIAENLLERHPSKRALEAASLQSLTVLIEGVVAEKRLEFRDRFGVVIEGAFGESVPEFVARVQPTEFQRALSNLVNNAVEAFANGPGRVRLAMSEKGGWIYLLVEDDGKGIPAEILSKLGVRGASYGKAGGSGLGLQHARARVESWGGRLDIASEPGKGTTVTIALPAARRQSPGGCDAVLIDDDPLVRKNWELSAEKSGVRIRTFSSAAEFVSSAADIDRLATVYVDSWLGEEESGVEEARRICDLGFHEVFLTTADARAAEVVPGHLKGVMGKTPPWGTAT